MLAAGLAILTCYGVLNVAHVFSGPDIGGGFVALVGLALALAGSSAIVRGRR